MKAKKPINKEKNRKIFNMIRLTFRNEVVQNCYNQDQIDLKIMLYKIILSVFFFASLIYLFYSSLITNDFPSFWVTLVFLIGVCVVLILSKYLLKTFPIFLSIIQLIFTFYCTEYFIPDRLKSYENKELFIVIGVSIAVLIMINITILNNWILKSLFLLFSVEFVVLRTYQLRALIFFPLHVLLLLMPVIFYTHELCQKKLFYKYYEQQQDLKEWKQLIDKHIPCSLFVITHSAKKENITNQDFQIKFANHTCLKQFQIEQQQELLTKLPNIYAKQVIKQQIYQSNTKNFQISQKKSIRYPLKCNNQQYATSVANLDINNTQNFSIESLNIIIQKKLQDNVYEELLAEDQNQKATQELRTFGAKGQEQIVNCYYQENENTNKKYYDIQLVYMMWESEKTIMVLLTDISEKVINERLRELDKYKDEMLNTITHDLKTPLNGILCFLEASQKNNDLKFIQQNIDISLINGQLLQLMIEDFIDYSQLMKGTFQLSPCRFKLLDLINDVFKLYKYQVEKKKIVLKCQSNLSNFDEAIMYNDQKRLKQVLNNLIGNAVKFTYTGSIIVIINIDNVDNNIINITVKDTGIGIPFNFQSKLFKLFGIEEENYEKSSKHGVGIGLTICQKLVEAIGPAQKIYLKSSQNIGSEFTIRIFTKLSVFDQDQILKNSIILDNKASSLQVVGKVDQQCTVQESLTSKVALKDSFLLTDERQQTEINKPIESLDVQYNPFIKFKRQYRESNNLIEQLNSQFPKNTRILIVDDTMFNVMALQVILGQVQNIQLDEVYNGQQALDIILEKKKENIFYQLILMDVNMPLMDGLEATKKIRELEAKNIIKNVQIYIVTAFGDESDKLKCAERDVTYHITKPVTMLNIIQALKDTNFSSFLKEQLQ